MVIAAFVFMARMADVVQVQSGLDLRATDDAAPEDLTQRERGWSQFLNDAYTSLQQKMAPVDEESAETGDDAEGGDAALEAAE